MVLYFRFHQSNSHALVEEPETQSLGVEMSETSSVAQSIDYELESVDGCSWVTEPPNMMEFDQKTPLGSKQCERQLRYAWFS